MKNKLHDSHGEQGAATDAPTAAMTPEEVAAAEQLQVDLMQFREGVERRVRARLPDRLAIRVPVFVGLAVVLMSWLQRHWQAPISGMLAGAAGALATYSFALPWLQRVFSKHRETIERGVAEVSVQYLGFLLGTPFLAVLFAATLIPNLFYSSVTVLADGRNVTLAPLDGHEPRVVSEPGDEATVYSASTSPFGRTFVLKVAGFQDETFTLYPGIGEQFTVDRLTRSPAVVLRLPPEVYDLSGERGEVRLYRRAADDSLELVGRKGTRSLYGSYVFGAFPGAVRDLGAGWDGDLEANDTLTGAVDDERIDPEKFEIVKWTWRNSLRAEFLTEHGVRAGDPLEAFFLRNAARGIESVQGHASFVVVNNERSVQDEMLFYVPKALREEMIANDELAAAMPAEEGDR